MNEIPLIKEGSDIRTHWRTVNSTIGGIAKARVQIGVLRTKVEKRGRGEYGSDLEPFEIYIEPIEALDLSALTEEEQTAKRESYWRECRVRHGYVNFVATQGCDDADGAGVTLELIEVPADTAAFFIWADWSDASAPVIRHTDEYGEHWDGYPAVSGTIRPLARITTEDGPPARIRQYHKGDIWPGGGESLPVWL
jgi:hypothetical protein